MTEPGRKAAPAPAGAARLLLTAAAVLATLAGWALLALETRHLAAAPTSRGPQPATSPFAPLPRLWTAEGARPAAGEGRPTLRAVDRPAPTPVALTRSSR